MAYKAGDLFVDIKGSTSGASKSISAIIKKLGLLQNSLKSIDTTNLSKISTELGAGGGTRSSRSSSSRSGITGILNIAKWTTAIYMGRRLGRIVADIAQEGANYTETLNLWETAMGSNLDVATEFVNKMNEAYGISEKTLMNAQAIFKNMLGSLGQISDTMAYQLSEGITQMALDYASLYNVTFEQAFTKFQAALAGQVRPIRSVAGYDITETTLFQLYQSLGGTKTMRQLTRTEKQLLSIYAIFQQMDKSGAIGDLDKTMESFANQSRVMAEAWQQVKSYAGILLTYSIRQSGIMVKINAVLIFIGDTLKALAESMGAIEHFGGDVFESTTESALGASDAIDEVKGKLLDFDKFRSLSSTEEENALGLDEKLLNALSNFNTILGDASMKARELAEHFKVASGLFDEEGVFNKDKWQEIVDKIKFWATLLVGILALNFFSKMGDGLVSFAKLAIKHIPAIISDFKKMQYSINMVYGAIFMLAIGITAFIGSWDDMTGVERAIGILATLATTLTAVAIAFHATHNWAKAIMIGAMVAGGTLLVSSALATANVEKRANGGKVDRGTMFVAGEAGTEVVSNTNGVTEVTNVKQMEQAFFNALTRYGSSNNGKIEVTLLLDGEKVYKNTTEHAKAHGYAWSKA